VFVQHGADAVRPASKPVLDVWIGEAVHLLKGAVEHVNRTIAEVRRVKEGSVGIGADRETLVHGASAAMGIVDGENRAGAAVHTGVPARNGAVLGREDEPRGSGYAAACDIEAGSGYVEHVAGRGRGCRLAGWGRDR